MKFLSDTLHLWILLFLLVSGGGVLLAARNRLIPATYGDKGPYRAAALTELAAKPSVFQADHVCHQCHQEVHDERADTKHQAVRCVHCHGLGVEHIAQARQAKDNPGFKITPASKWDGNFLTKIDLFITKDKKTCLVCHEDVVGMPKSFRKINAAGHLKEMGASEPTSRETCFECHAGHNTAP